MTQAGTTQESSLLLTLEEISQLVSHSHDPQQTLANIVQLIQGRFHTAVCSVYLLEPERGELVLGATVGLRLESVGRVRMRLDEGLTGLVAEQMAPVAVEDAFQHPRFKYFPEAGEDPYHSFLGVPLIEGGSLQGVLVVQTVEPRRFSPNETRLLVTVASQLAPLVSEAQLLERLAAAAHNGGAFPAAAADLAPLCGVSLSPGSGVGIAYLVNGFDDGQRTAETRSTDPAGERRRLAEATAAVRDEITRLSQRISALVGQDHGAILQAQLMLLQDRTIEQDLAGCLAAGSTAEAALLQVLDKYVAAFQKLASPLFQERIYDLKDVFRRLLWQLRPRPAAPEAADEPLVLVAHEASVMDLFALDHERLAAIAVERGGPQSHAAILARSLGIPMVGQVPGLVDRLRPGRRLLVDGSAGVVRLDPASVTASPCRAVDAAAEMPAGDDLPPGAPRIEANVNLLCEVTRAVRQRAAGVGLYRTEFLFLARRTLPTEEEQVGTYRKLLELLHGRPAAIRTFDLRPDKLPQGSPLHSAAAGPLDWRRVLDSLPLQKLFKDQVRAILRAATAGPVRILVPLVTRTELLEFVLQTVAEARAELRRDGLKHGEDVPVGVMIETAAAAMLAENWAERVDSFALGTNDLVASALGMDRDDPFAADQCDPLHPGVLRLIRDVVRAAHRANRRVTVCGEMAADPDGILVLAALQVDALSMAVHQLAAARLALIGRSPAALAELGPLLLRARTAGEVREILHRPG